MKKLILRYLEIIDGIVSFKIVEQSHREYEFGVDTSHFWTSRDINLSSVSCPAISLSSPRVFYCRGNDISSDHNIVLTIPEIWEKIKVAVREYNAYFGYPGECILGEIMEDIVPKEMFMVD